MMPLAAFACTCEKCPDQPKTYCPRGRAIIRRQRAQKDDMTSTIENSRVATDDTGESFAALAARKRDKLRTLVAAPEAQREAALKANAPIAAAYYKTEAGRAELADWRAIQDEPFHD
jgi:DNA-binding PadR family transcriptional regulator